MNISGNLKCFWPSGQEWAVLQQMDKLHFPRPWTLEQWQTLAPANHHLFFWIIKNQPIGLALFAHLPGDETAHLLKICLEPDYRRKGMGHAFWNGLVHDLKLQQVEKVFLEVEESNKVAQSFYKKVGFETLRTVRSYYSDGENGVMMLLTL